MIWIILSMLSGLGDAFSFVYMKKLSTLDAILILLFRHIAALPFLLFTFLFFEIPKVTLTFYVVVLVNALVLIISMFLMIKSLQISDLSVSIPMLSFTPIFLLFTSYIMLKEIPSFFGFIGIFIVVAGSYILNISSAKHGYFEPFKLIFKEKGIFYMFAVAFLFSITASLSKIGIELSNPAFYVFMVFLFVSVSLLILFFNRIKANVPIIRHNIKSIAIMGISTAFADVFAAIAYKFAIVPYVISLKRTSVIFSVILGFFYFREKSFKEAIIGAIIMFVGVLLITLS